MRHLFTIAFLIVSTLINAQPTSQGIHQFANLNTLGSGNGTWITNTSGPKIIQGSPYLYDTWNNKSLIYFDDKVYKLNAFNYNIRLERFEAKFSTDSVLALNPRGINKIEVDDKIFIRCLDPEYMRNSYFEIISTINGVAILRKFELEIKEGKINPMTLQQMQPDKFIKKEHFFISKSKDRDDLEKIKLKKSRVLSMLDKDKVDQVKSHASDNKLRFKDVDHLKKILRYYKTL